MCSEDLLLSVRVLYSVAVRTVSVQWPTPLRERSMNKDANMHIKRRLFARTVNANKNASRGAYPP